MTTRFLGYPLYFSSQVGASYDVPAVFNDPFTWPSQDPDEVIDFVGSLSLREYIQLSSAVDVGRDIAYPDQSVATWGTWVKMITGYNPGAPTKANCALFGADSAALDYVFNSPFLTPVGEPVNGLGRWATWQDLVEYVVPNWLQDLNALFGDLTGVRVNAGYEENDVFYLPFDITDPTLPLSPQWFYDQVQAIYNFDIPRISFTVVGEGTMEIKALTQPLGGLVLVVVDRPFSLADFFLDWLNGGGLTLPGVTVVEVDREITQIPPNTTPDADIDLVITGQGEHTVELWQMPRLDPGGGILGYGGGFRSVELCDGLQMKFPDGSLQGQNGTGLKGPGVIIGTKEELDELIQRTRTVGTLQDNVEKSNDINQGLYGFASDIFDRLDSSNPDSFVPALVWERRFSQRLVSPDSLRVTIEPGFLAFRIVASVQGADSVPRFVYCYLNGDFTGANYRGHETSRNQDIDNPVIGVSNTVGDESTKQVVATMYDYESNLHKVMLADSLGMNPAETTTRVQGGFAFYWRDTQPVTFIDLVLSGIQYQSIDLEVHYLREELVMVSQDLGLKPPPPGALDDVQDQGYTPGFPDWFYYSMDDLTDFTNVPGSWNPDPLFGNPAPSIVDDITTQGGGNFTIEPDQPLFVNEVSFELYVTGDAYQVDVIRVIIYDVNGVDFEIFDLNQPSIVLDAWQRITVPTSDFGRRYDRVLVQILSVTGPGTTPTRYAVDNLYIAGTI